MESIEADEIIDHHGVAKMLGIHEKTVRNLLLKGEIPGRRIGKSWFSRKSAIYKLIPTEVAFSHE